MIFALPQTFLLFGFLSNSFLPCPSVWCPPSPSLPLPSLRIAFVVSMRHFIILLLDCMMFEKRSLQFGVSVLGDQQSCSHRLVWLQVWWQPSFPMQDYNQSKFLFFNKVAGTASGSWFSFPLCRFSWCLVVPKHLWHFHLVFFSCSYLAISRICGPMYCGLFSWRWLEEENYRE